MKGIDIKDRPWFRGVEYSSRLEKAGRKALESQSSGSDPYATTKSCFSFTETADYEVSHVEQRNSLPAVGMRTAPRFRGQITELGKHVST